jgi:aryl-alcohol dehydrogenase-like predicted oxidoreductase
MERVRLGLSDLDVSRLCLGTMTFGWTADERESFAILDVYAEAGGNFLDSADIYSRWARGNTGGESESIVGKWLKARGNRNQFVIATKVRGRMWPGPAGEGLGREHILKSCDYSLKRLGVETIDLYQCHWADASVPFEETLGAFRDLIRAGKVRHVGVSNFSPAELGGALAIAGKDGLPPIVSLQPHFNLVHRASAGEPYEGELQDLCLEHNVGVTPYSPLAKGLLTGRYSPENVKKASRSGVNEYFHARTWPTVDAVREVASVRGTTMAAVSLSWLLAQPGITAPILGARTSAQLAEQLPAATLRLTAAELARLSEVSGQPL